MLLTHTYNSPLCVCVCVSPDRAREGWLQTQQGPTPSHRELMAQKDKQWLRERAGGHMWLLGQMDLELGDSWFHDISKLVPEHGEVQGPCCRVEATRLWDLASGFQDLALESGH